MSITTTSHVLSVILVIWLATLGRSFTIMISGRRIFQKASKGEKTAYYPIINLFTMLEVANISTFLGILLFIPGLNLIILAMMSYKLGNVFNTSVFYKIGLVLFPIMFYPLLSFSDKQYRLKDEQYFKTIENISNDNNNLMTEEEIQTQDFALNEEYEKEIDSIFKRDIDLMEQVAPYKATKIDVLSMEKLKQNSDDELFKPIKRINPINSDIEFVDLDKTLNDKDNKDIEMLDL